MYILRYVTILFVILIFEKIVEYWFVSERTTWMLHWANVIQNWGEQHPLMLEVNTNFV